MGFLKLGLQCCGESMEIKMTGLGTYFPKLSGGLYVSPQHILLLSEGFVLSQTTQSS